MGEMGEVFREMKEQRSKLRAAYGLPCPRCVALLPKSHPSILLPTQACKIHGYVDPRPRLNKAQLEAVGIYGYNP